MKTTRLFIIFCTSALLGSCGIYKNYERPAEISAVGIYGDAQSGGEQGLGDLQWRQIFTDPTLQSLIEKVLAQNSNMRQADLRIQEMQNNLKAARLAFFPSLAFAPSGTISGIVDPYDRDKYKAVMGGGANKTYSFPLSMNWQIDAFGTLRNTKKNREVAVEQMKSVRQAVQTSLIANVANLYYTLAMLDQQHAIAEETTEKWSKTLEMTRHLMDAGMTNKSAVASTEANYWAIRTSTLELELSIRKIENALSTLLGETPHTISRGKLADFQLPAACTTGFPIGVLSRRPDVKQAELTLASAFYNKNIAKAAFYPALNITANGQYANSITGAGIVNPGGIIMAAVASLTQPIFQNGRIRAAYKNSQAEMDIAAIGFQQTLIEAGAEVNNAMADLNTDLAERELYENQVRSYTEAVDANEKLFRESSNNYLNVLTAQSGLLNAQMSQASTDFSIIADVVTLYQALGGGAE
ncbi:MAG: efflux transporter outer membrane subunit [Bacteroidaceae bacterium]|nr:efflux transporter outer membrane subunit [Bacteroidaceae bacterium]